MATPTTYPGHTVIRIHYPEPPAGATLGVRCGESGGDGNDWAKFYFAVKKGDTWTCSVPMAKEGALIEFKPLLQYNASTPTWPSPSYTTFNFSSPDLRKSFLSSSSSALFKSQSQADFGDIKSPQKNFKKEENLMKEVLKKEEFKQEIKQEDNKKEGPLPKDKKEVLKMESPKKQALMSPLRPSAFSVAGEKDESYAVGANYITFAGHTIDVYPWFFNWQGTIETIKDVESKTLPFKSKRDVIVYLPPSYNENTLKKYPVMIMQDAHNLFYENISFAGRIWKVPFSMDELCASGVISETIIVAITPIRREYEYLPKAPDSKPECGGADLYLDFIGKELKPMIEGKYRTNSEYGIAGSSYGGIISLYAWLTRPKEYKLCGCYSPSLRWHHDYMFTVAKQVVENMRNTHANHLLYLDAGTEYDQLTATIKMARLIEKAFVTGAREPRPIKHETSGQTRAAEVFDKLIAATGIDDQFGVRNIASVGTVGAVLASGKVMMNVGEGHNHSEDSWAKRTPLALNFLLRDPQRESRWAKEVVEDISSRVLD